MVGIDDEEASSLRMKDISSASCFELLFAKETLTGDDEENRHDIIVFGEAAEERSGFIIQHDVAKSKVTKSTKFRSFC